MDRSAILRFSDAEVPTVAEHKKILAEARAVWWGWWKKQTESFPLQTLRYLKTQAKREPIRLGLVKRKGEEELYVALCVDISFSDDGSPISSPEGTLTPEYYREGKFPAWFKLSEIIPVTREAFVREFGSVPSSDPTFYEVFRDKEIEIRPRPDWSMEVIEAPGDAILHVSDLHFGTDHGFPLRRRVPGRGLDDRPLAEIISYRIFRDLGIRVGVVVVSGDLITRGDANAYAEAKTFLEDLLTAFNLEPRHCVIVPGNHDLWIADDDEHPTRDYRHEQPYRMFVDAFFGAKLQDLERVRRFRTPGGFELVFIELNSARLRSDFLREYGYVSKHRYADLLHFVMDVPRQNSGSSAAQLKFAVLHHHLVPVGSVAIPEEKRPVSLCLDAGELISEFQTHGIRFVLHGHEHMPFVGTVCRIPDQDGQSHVWRYEEANAIFVLACGSSGARRDRLPPELDRNVFGIYVPTLDSLKVTFEQYNRSSSPSPLWKMSLPIS